MGLDYGRSEILGGGKERVDAPRQGLELFVIHGAAKDAEGVFGYGLGSRVVAEGDDRVAIRGREDRRFAGVDIAHRIEEAAHGALGGDDVVLERGELSPEGLEDQDEGGDQEGEEPGAADGEAAEFTFDVRIARRRGGRRGSAFGGSH